MLIKGVDESAGGLLKEVAAKVKMNIVTVKAPEGASHIEYSLLLDSSLDNYFTTASIERTRLAQNGEFEKITDLEQATQKRNPHETSEREKKMFSRCGPRVKSS